MSWSSHIGNKSSATHGNTNISPRPQLHVPAKHTQLHHHRNARTSFLFSLTTPTAASESHMRLNEKKIAGLQLPKLNIHQKEIITKRLDRESLFFFY
jgi:hypothetical protein